MGTILLLRHGTHAEVGRVLSGRSEVPLDATGQLQAATVRARLTGTAIASIHASPRARTRATAAPIAAAKGLEVRQAAALDEIDFGAFAGRTFIELASDADWDQWNAARATFRCPGGETMNEAIDRALGYLAALPDDALPALCVSHCDIIRGIVARVLGLGLDRLFQFDCDPASLTRLERHDGAFRVGALNLPID